MDPAATYGALDGAPTPAQQRPLLSRLFQPPTLPGASAHNNNGIPPPTSPRGGGSASPTSEASGFGPRKRHFDGGRQFGNKEWDFLRAPAGSPAAAAAAGIGDSSRGGTTAVGATQQQPPKPKFRAGWQGKRRVPGARASLTSAAVPGGGSRAGADAEQAAAAMIASGAAPAPPRSPPGGRLVALLSSGQRPRARGVGAPRAVWNPINWARSGGTGGGGGGGAPLVEPLLDEGGGDDE